MAPDLQSINRNDLGVMVAGGLAFIASFLPYWGISFEGSGIPGGSVTAWHGYAILGLLLMFAAAIIIAVKTFSESSMPELPVGIHVLAAGLAGLGTLLVILRAFTYPHADGQGVSVGVKWGGYVLFIAGIVEVVFAVLAMRESGETIGGGGGSTAAPPPPPPAA